MSASTISGKILHNSFWYGLELVLEHVIMLVTSIAVARYLGPEKLGYFSAVSFPVFMVSSASGQGLAMATRKYMAEYLGIDKPGVARSIYNFNWRYQLISSSLITVVGLVCTTALLPHQYRWMGAILVASIIPGLMSWVPAQANLAFEDAASNTRSALGYIAAYTIIVVLTIFLKWDLVGIAAAIFVGRCLEAILRTVPLHRKLASIPSQPMPQELSTRIGRFCMQAIFIQLLTSVVWDRSEIFFLTAFSGVAQVAFYSVSVGLVDRLLMIPRTFGSAAGVSLMSESARDPKRVSGIVYSSCRFLFLVTWPVCLGAMITTKPAVLLAYGQKFAPAIPVMVIAAALAVPRAFQLLPDTMMRAADRQWDLLRVMIYTAIFNAIVDLAIIPRYGAVGAAIGNGVAQMVGVTLLWVVARRSYDYEWPWDSMLRIGAAGIGMALLAYAASFRLPNLPAIVAAVATAVPVYIFLLRITRALEPTDYLRLMMLARPFPKTVFDWWDAIVKFVIPDFGSAKGPGLAGVAIVPEALSQAQMQEAARDLGSGD